MNNEIPQNIYHQRQVYSQTRIDELINRIGSSAEVMRFSSLTIYATGSYARNEASKHSDIDLFFIYRGGKDAIGSSRIDQMRMFSKIIEITDYMKFPKFSNDGEFLKFLYEDDILQHLGGREDDYMNCFTARLLLLLESKAIYNSEEYLRLIDNVIESYMRDYPDHPQDFRPTFLVNDIIRFWKTLCLNYEHKRNQPDDDSSRKLKQKIKNFKLKYSRMLTCFATLIALIVNDDLITRDHIHKLVTMTPRQRLHLAGGLGSSEKNAISLIDEEYEWFIEKTGLSTEELEEYFSVKENRIEAFSHANNFGSIMYSLIDNCARKRGYLRYLVV